tara:strand:+ start:238 stop:666 length:429 start_codon:yes stop_codon:yes gene_type:complete
MQGIKKDMDLQNQINRINANMGPSKDFQSLVDNKGGDVAWDVNDGLSAYLFADGGGNRNLLAPTNVEDGDFGTLMIKQGDDGGSGSGSQITLQSGKFSVVDNGTGEIALSDAEGDIDILTWVYNGTFDQFYVTVGLDFTNDL